jgi:hypothetical protein
MHNAMSISQPTASTLVYFDSVAQYIWDAVSMTFSYLTPLSYTLLTPTTNLTIFCRHF